MEIRKNVSRRMILKGFGGAALATGTVAGGETLGSKWKIAGFGKPFQTLAYEEAAETLAEIGFDGVEATVRGSGHVLPGNVKRDLPKLFRAVAANGLDFTGMATHIRAANQEHTREILETAAGLGIRRYRMDYFRYDLGKPIPPQVDAFRREAALLAELNAEVGIQGLYQNHAGKRFAGAGIWDLDQILADCDPQHLGVAYDLRHAKVEAGMSWGVGYELIKRRIEMLYVKDFRWSKDKLKNVPLGEGIVGADFYKKLAASRPMPVSLHIEYGNHRDPVEATAGLKRDLEVIRGWLG